MSNISSNITIPDVIFYDPGDTAWMIAATAFVLFQIFGLAIFYGSLLPSRNSANAVIETIAALGVVTIQWTCVGYSFAFADDSSSFFGSFQYGGLKDIANWQEFSGPRDVNAPTIPATVFVAYQLTFAALSAALLAGSITGRMKFHSFLIFVLLWTTIVYDTIAHWCWSIPGWLHQLGTLDFAGGSVVHINAGFSALAISIVLSIRKSPKPKLVEELDHMHNLLGAGILWFGWIGFNSGSALAANQAAGIALLNTILCPGSTMFFWMVAELLYSRVTVGRPVVSVEGPLFAVICGLVVITPCAGYIEPGYSVCIGIYTAVLCYAALLGWKALAKRFHWFDDGLYIFVSHGISGIIGSFTTGLFASNAININVPDGAFYGNGVQLAIQLADIASTAAWSFCVSFILMIGLKYTIGVNASEEEQTEAPETPFGRQKTAMDLHALAASSTASREKA